MDAAYLGYRNPLTIWSSPAIVWPKRRDFMSEDDQLEYAAKVISGMLDFKHILDKYEKKH